MKFIDDFEAHYNYDCTYMREMAKVSPDGFKAFCDFLPMGRYSKATSNEVIWTARLGAILTEDCGACVQLNISMALENGLSSELVQTIVQKPEELSDDLKLIFKFSQSVAEGDYGFTDLRVAIEEKYTKEQIVELGLAISATKIYPTIKRAMGYFKSCSLYDFTF